MRPFFSFIALLFAVSSTAAPAPKAILIGIDGLAPFAVNEALTPTLVELGEHGILDLEGRNCWQKENAHSGQSAPNWATLLTGVSPKVHGVSRNGDSLHKVADLQEGAVPSIFGRLKAQDASLTTAMVNTWKGIGIEKGSILGRCTESIDHHFRNDSDKTPAERDELNLATTLGLLNKPQLDFLFLHLGNVDAMGHQNGWNSAPYQEAVKSIDQSLKMIVTTIKGRDDFANEDWLLILTSDHGGKEKGHTDNTLPVIYEVPYLVIRLSADGATGSLLDEVPKPWTHYETVPALLGHFEKEE